MPIFTVGAAGTTSSSYEIDNSLRFDRGSSEKLSFTQGSGDDTTARRKWTFSTWIKRGQLVNTSNHQYFFGVGSYTLIGFRKDDVGEADDLYVQVGTGSSAQGVHANAKFRDTSAWMNIYVAFDSTDGTAANRLKVYVNGNLVDSAYGDYSSDQRSSITQNNEDDFVGNSGDTINIGYSTNGTNSYFDGYMADTHLLIGTTKDYTDFGESNNDGIWIPKETSFSTSDYGTNGFKLEYKQTGTSANSSGLGADTSGNDNHFTVSNLTSVDQTTDTPTNNYCTINPLDNYYTGATISEGNLKVVSTNSNRGWNIGTIGVSQGKWYWEIKYVASGGSTPSDKWNHIGIADRGAESSSDILGESNYQYSVFESDGKVYASSATGTTYGAAFSTGDIVQVALDLDNDNVYFGLNGQWGNGSGSWNQASPSSAVSIQAPSGTLGGNYFPAIGDGGVNVAKTWEANFGNPTFSISSSNSDGNSYGNFEYAVPSGYYALNTKNLAEFG